MDGCASDDRTVPQPLLRRMEPDGGQDAMRGGDDKDRTLARQARLVSIVIAATMVLWMLSQWVGRELGLDMRYVFLFDLFALAGFIWALVVTWQIWRKRGGE